MKEQLAFQKMLLMKYEELRSKNSKFSRRAFAKKVGVSPGAISEIVNGQRRISLKLAGKISDRLGLDPQERSEVLAVFKADQNPAAALQQKRAYLQLSTDQFRLIADWYHFGILTLMRTRGFRSDRKWIADRLGVLYSPDYNNGAWIQVLLGSWSYAMELAPQGWSTSLYPTTQNQNEDASFSPYWCYETTQSLPVNKIPGSIVIRCIDGPFIESIELTDGCVTKNTY